MQILLKIVLEFLSIFKMLDLVCKFVIKLRVACSVRVARIIKNIVEVEAHWIQMTGIAF